MKILFDNGTPKSIARSLANHEITYARRIGWHELGNGELIQQAEKAGYDVLLSTDKNIRYQQNLRGRNIALSATRLHRRLGHSPSGRRFDQNVNDTSRNAGYGHFPMAGLPYNCERSERNETSYLSLSS